MVGTRRWQKALAGAAFVIALLVVWRLLAPPPSLEEVAREVLEAQARGDAGTILRWTWPEEIEANGLNRANLQRFIDTICKPALIGFTPTGPPKVISSMPGGDLHLSQPLAHPDGRITSRDIVARNTERGPVVTSVVGSLYGAAMAASAPPGRPTYGEQRLRVSIAYINSHLSELKATGLRGFVRYSGDSNNPDVVPQLTTWEEWAESRQRLLDSGAVRKPR